MPPIALYSSEFDFLLRESLVWAERLKKHGKLIGFSNMPGVIHGYNHINYETDETKWFFEDEKLAFDSYVLDKPIPQYTIHYMPFYGRAEASIMMLEKAGVPYNLKVYRLDNGEWAKVKPTMPNKQVPALEFKDGTMMGQSYSMARFIGANHGFYPDGPMECYKIDSLLDALEDVLGKAATTMFTPENEREPHFE